MISVINDLQQNKINIVCHFNLKCWIRFDYNGIVNWQKLCLNLRKTVAVDICIRIPAWADLTWTLTLANIHQWYCIGKGLQCSVNKIHSSTCTYVHSFNCKISVQLYSSVIQVFQSLLQSDFKWTLTKHMTLPSIRCRSLDVISCEHMVCTPPPSRHTCNSVLTPLHCGTISVLWLWRMHVYALSVWTGIEEICLCELVWHQTAVAYYNFILNMDFIAISYIMGQWGWVCWLASVFVWLLGVGDCVVVPAPPRDYCYCHLCWLEVRRWDRWSSWGVPHTSSDCLDPGCNTNTKSYWFKFYQQSHVHKFMLLSTHNSQHLV